jgi:cobalt/nickel transport system permease protein
MALLHAVIGLGEALITGAVVRFLLVRRPDLFDEPETAIDQFQGAKNWGQAIAGGLAVALAIAVFLAPFASEQPDGLSYVGAKLGFLREDEAARIPAPLPDYQLPIAGAAHVKVATAAAGLVGTLAVFGVALAMARILPRPKQLEACTDGV